MNLLLLSNKFQTNYFALVAGIAILFVLNLPARAISLTEYRKNVQEAVMALDELQSSELKERLTRESTTLRKVRLLLPARVTVEVPGETSLEVDNEWLETKLKEFENPNPASDNKLQILREVAEQLGAIEYRLDELEKAAIINRSKNSDKQKLNEILRRPEFKKPEKSLWQKWWDDFWKRDEESVKEERPPAFEPAVGLVALGAILRFVVIALALAVIGFVFWRFIWPLLRRRADRKLVKTKTSEPRVILGEELAQDVTPDDLLTEAERLARSGNVRAAIRKGYIALLCELNDRKILGLARHKTNRDYLSDLGKRDNLLPPMRALTESFERHWYGDAPAEEMDWQKFRAQYQQVVSSKQ